MMQRKIQSGKTTIATVALRGLRCRIARLLSVVLPMSFIVPSTSSILQGQQYAGANCVATMENRSVPVAANGTYVIPNVPVNPGQYRARVVCTQPDGTVLGTTSPYTVLTPNGSTVLPSLALASLSAQPSMLKVLVISGALSSVGAQVQLETQSIDPTAFAYDATPLKLGTTWSTSNPAVATVDTNGLVTAKGPGTVIITARNDGLASTIALTSFGLLDSDGDGLPDDYEIANGLNPYDPTDATLDPDNDGLTTLQEFKLGTNPHAADTDGDGLNDGDEVKLGTNPLVADTDGDGLTDGDEVRLGTNPLVADTDGDGIPDGIEVKIGTNPLVPDVTTTVTGHVTNANGTPYLGASVTVFTYFTTTTDNTGAFSLTSIPVTLGNLVVSARAVIGTSVYNGASASTPPRSNAVTDVGTIQLGQSPGQVSGTVYSPDNKPVAGALLTVTEGTDTRTSITDSSGLYIVTGLQPGPVSIAAFDPLTSLRGQAMGTLTAGGPLTLNVTLGGFGTVSGTVRNAAATPVAAGVSVSITGALNASTITDTLGHYTFAFVPLGGYTVDAIDANGNHGRTAGSITATAMTNRADIQYLGRGTVSGTVADAQGNPVAGAAISLSNSGLFGQQLSATTNSLGQYSIAGVFVGTVNVAATLAASNTGSSVTGNVTADGQTVTVNLTLLPTANLTGTIFRKDGITPVAGASVSLRNTGYAATANSVGQYSITNVPLGTYTAMASDPGSADRGSASAVLSTAGQTVTANVNMVGVGTLVVTVLDASGNPVSGASVEVDGSSPYTQTQTGVTGSAGSVTINQQLTGSVVVRATNNAAGLSGSANATVTAGSSTSVTVQLQPSGTISGKVFKHDAMTPLSSATLLLDGGQRTLSDSTGAYSFVGVPSGTHSVQVVDSVNNQLAYNNNLVIATQGQVVTANFVIIARGTVTGHLTFSDGSAAPGASVQVTSSASAAGNPLGGQSDATGLYITNLVPAGSYQVAVQLRQITYACVDPKTNQAVAISTGIFSNFDCPLPDYVVAVSEKDYYGKGSGTLSTDGQTVVTDVQISQQVSPSSATYTDANGFSYPVRQNGGLYDGSFAVFHGDGSTHEGGSILSLVSNGNSTPFLGAQLASGGAIEQDGIYGLNVVRKVYVPNDGYFARYLELLTNPGSTDVTVGVQLNSYFRNVTEDFKDNSGNTQNFTDVPHILLTSSGDTTLDVTNPTTPDNWVTLGGPADRDPFIQDQFADTPIPAIADVFSGPGAALQPTSAAVIRDSSGTFVTLTENYATVRVPAGGTVGILHFLSQENEYSAANASAARLVQLPKEAVAGLTQTDLSAVSNWNVPTNGQSAVPDLPSLNNQVTGFVYASDGTTVIPNAIVHLQSSDPIFARTYVGTADANGAYSFQGGTGSYVVTPENYSVYGTHPTTASPLTAACAQNGHYIGAGCAIDSPTFNGTFDTHATQSSTDITFSNTGILKGTVSRGPTVVNVAGTVSIVGSSVVQVSVPIQSDGTYIITGVMPGTYSLTAAVTNTLLQGTTSATVTAGSTTTANITIIEAGSVQGTVTRSDSSLAVSDTVNLRANGIALQATTDTSGHYGFTDIPIGNYTVDVYDSLSNSAATATAVVTANATTTVNLPLQSAGTVNGTVSVNDGSSVSGLTVTLTSATSSGTQSLSTTTSATGAFTFTGVKPGTIVVHTTNAGGLQGTGTGSLPLAGQTITINIALMSAGNVTGTVFHADGTTRAAGIQVTISPAPLTGTASTTTDANGTFSFPNQPFGGFTVYASNAATGDQGQASGQIQANGQLRTVNITLDGFGTLVVKVVDASANLVPSASVKITNYAVGTNYTGKTDSTGTATFTNIAAGAFGAFATDPVTGLSAQQTGSLVPNSTQNLTLTLQSTGTVQGTVFAPNGTTPEAGATVQLNAPYGPTTTTASDGTYKFASQQVGGSYAVQARDGSGLVRANVPAQSLQTNGQVLTQNLTFVGVGSVSGTVTNADSSRGENLTLSIQSKNSKAPSTQTVTTGGDGTYTVVEVPVGPFTVTVTGLPSNLAGFTSGTITTDGDHETANIQIQSSTVQLPLTLTDADGFGYPIAIDGRYAGTVYNFFGYSPFYSAQGLTVTVNGAASNFNDGSSPTTSIQSLSGQQVEINQPSLNGLNVTRKIYVPSDGYFARRFEVLQNPSSSPITVTVAISGPDRYSTLSPTVINTSNGNTTVDDTILWAVDDDDTGASPYPASQPAHANVFAGPNAPTGMSAVARSTYYYPGYYNNPSYTSQTWSYTYAPVTIPANGKASFLFFTAQEATAATATSAAQRLDQLPSEALAGLSSDDLASVVNFVVPTAPLAALHPPATTASLNGTVKTGDGSLPIPKAVVYAQSTDPEYGGGATATADAYGVYAMPSINANSYAEEAVDPSTTAKSPVISGNFTAGATSQVQDILFTNTGIVSGIVKATGNGSIGTGTIDMSFYCSSAAQTTRSALIPMNASSRFTALIAAAIEHSSGSVTPNASAPVYCGFASQNYASDGTFQFLTVPAGNQSIEASIYGPTGGYIYLPIGSGSYQIGVAAAQTTQFTFTIPASGTITGKVTNADGTPAVGVSVGATPSSYNKGISDNVKTGADGTYTMSTLLLDTYTVTAYDPTTTTNVSGTTTLTQDSVNTVNLKFLGKGTVVATVKYANGNIAQGVSLRITSAAATGFNASGTTDANGQYTFGNVPTGNFTVLATYPGQNFYSTTTGTVVGTGSTQQLAVTLTPVGTISGTLTYANGTPASGQYVTANDATNTYSGAAQTDSAGGYALYPAPADRPLTVASSYYDNTTGKTFPVKVVNQQIPGDAQTLTVNLRYPGLANVKVSVLNADGSTASNVYVTVRSSDGVQNFTMTTASDGTATFKNVEEAAFVAIAYTGNTGYNLGSTKFTVGPSDDGNTVLVTVHATPSGTVQGQVYAGDGTTVIRDGYNVIITDIDAISSNSSNPTGGQGYNFQNVQVGASGFQLTAQLGTAKQSVTGNITTQGETITQNFTVPVSSISGTVFLHDGVTPVPYAQIFATQIVSGTTNSWSTTTDVNGTYQVSGPVTGSVRVQAQDENGVSSSIPTSLATDTSIVTGVNVSLGATGTVLGTVYNAAGQIQTYSYVDISSSGNNGGFSTSVQSDTNGNYQMSDIPVGNITVSFYDQNTQQTLTATGVLNNDGDTVTINVGNVPNMSGGRVFGTVYDSNGNPSPGATVTIQPASSSSSVFTATSDSNGVYSSSGLPLGNVTVSAVLSDGTNVSPVTGNIPDITNPVEIDLGLTDNGNVSGLVTDSAGNPLAGYDINVASSGDTSMSYGESSGSDGSFYFSSIAPGTVTVQVTDANGTVIGTNTGVLPYGGNLTINVKTSVASAEVTKPPTTNAILLASVHVRNPLLTFNYPARWMDSRSGREFAEAFVSSHRVHASFAVALAEGARP